MILHKWPEVYVHTSVASLCMLHQMRMVMDSFQSFHLLYLNLGSLSTLSAQNGSL